MKFIMELIELPLSSYRNSWSWSYGCIKNIYELSYLYFRQKKLLLTTLFESRKFKSMVELRAGAVPSRTLLSWRPKRSGIRYVEGSVDRNLTYFKRRSGLFKTAADMSTLTGAKVAIVLESETQKMSAFGTPAAEPIIDSFLSGGQPPELTDEAQKARIARLQNEVFELEQEIAAENRRKKEAMARFREILQTSIKAKLIFGNIEELDFDKLTELLQGLLRLDQEVKGLLPPPPSPQQLQQADGASSSSQLEVGASSSSRDVPSLQQQVSSSLPNPPPPPPPIQLPQRRLPWTDAQEPLFQFPGVHIHHTISQPPFLSAPPPPPPPPPPSFHFAPNTAFFPPPPSTAPPQQPFPVEALQFQPQSFSFIPAAAAGQGQPQEQSPSLIPSGSLSYPYQTSVHGLGLGDNNGGRHGGHAAAGHANDIAGPSGSHGDPLKWISKHLLESSSSSGGESSDGGAASVGTDEIDLSDIDLFGDDY